MIVVLQADGSVRLEQADDFRRFHCEIDASLADLAAARAAFARVGQLASEDVAWVDRDALMALGAAIGGDAWREQAESTLAVAARHGWIRDRSPGIRSHVVWNRPPASA